MKSLFFALLFVFTIQINSQTCIKFNVPTAFVLVPNIGIETSIGSKTTFSVDIMSSFWNSFDGKKPMKFHTLTPEIRYHFKEKFNGFYAGIHAGPDLYKLQKWGYWNTNYYEDGIGYRIGATIGYNIKLNDDLLLDVFAGGGWHQGFYNGYYNDGTPGKYEDAKRYNKSGEWLPYRGGVMLSYKLN